MQTGIGFDAHKLVPGIDLMLGGVLIDHPFGLEGHSDGDVLLHAISDALLGAASMGDIGRYFPSTSSRLKSIPSSDILAMTSLADLGEEVSIEFVAPTKPGRYLYICTYIAHAATMRGYMIVE